MFPPPKGGQSFLSGRSLSILYLLFFVLRETQRDPVSLIHLLRADALMLVGAGCPVTWSTTQTMPGPVNYVSCGFDALARDADIIKSQL